LPALEGFPCSSGLDLDLKVGLVLDLNAIIRSKISHCRFGIGHHANRLLCIHVQDQGKCQEYSDHATETNLVRSKLQFAREIGHEAADLIQILPDAVHVTG